MKLEEAEPRESALDNGRDDGRDGENACSGTFRYSLAPPDKNAMKIGGNKGDIPRGTPQRRLETGTGTDARHPEDGRAPRPRP